MDWRAKTKDHAGAAGPMRLPFAPEWTILIS
jgi:hypothetical protein